MFEVAGGRVVEEASGLGGSRAEEDLSAFIIYSIEEGIDLEVGEKDLISWTIGRLSVSLISSCS